MNTVIYREDGSHLPEGMLTDEQRDTAFQRLQSVREIRDQAREVYLTGPTYGAVDWDAMAGRMVELEADIKSKLDADDDAHEQLKNMVCVQFHENSGYIKAAVVDPETGEQPECGNLFLLGLIDGTGLGSSMSLQRFPSVNPNIGVQLNGRGCIELSE